MRKCRDGEEELITDEQMKELTEDSKRLGSVTATIIAAAVALITRLASLSANPNGVKRYLAAI